MSDSYDIESYMNPYDYLYRREIIRAKKEMANVPIKKQQLEDNKFYIGSNSIFQRGGKGWGHPTEAEAVEHAQRMLSEQPGTGEVFIVEIIKVVRRKPIDVDIEEV